ncbi:MAG TPA: hypothetical protein VGK73_40180 [Polyangiaceae bacterium]
MSDDPNKEQLPIGQRIPLPGRVVPVSLQRGEVPLTDEVAFWEVIRNASKRVSFPEFERYIDRVCGKDREEIRRLRERGRVPFTRVGTYELLKGATDAFLRVRTGVLGDGRSNFSSGTGGFSGRDGDDDVWERMAKEASLHLERAVSAADLEDAWNSYVGRDGTIPYLDLLRAKFDDCRRRDHHHKDGDRRDYDDDGRDRDRDRERDRDRDEERRPFERDERESDDDFQASLCAYILDERARRPALIELIWSYWHEEAMLVQVLAAISLRFQNRRGPRERPLFAQLELDPLRPLNNLLWGYIQDEQHRLSIVRRAYEYEHHYGLRLVGKAVGDIRPMDVRSNFLGGFHRLLQQASRFYQQDDVTTVRADAFPVLNALKEVNIALGEGGSNQYGDLPWVARGEMLMQQWILARREMRDFFSSRPSAIYPETWMERLESARALLGVNGPSILHLHNLATMGERLLLSIRFHPWTDTELTTVAANWARSFRSDIQGYIHAYHAVTGVDLSAASVTDRIDARLPSVLMRERIESMARR